MKTILTLMAIVAGVVLTSCASAKDGLTLATVGPVPARAGGGSTGSGTLVVYSAYEVSADFNSRDPNRPEYSDYRIYAADGRFLRKVRNDSGTIFQDPRRVVLPAGRYRVLARANGYGFITIPVKVEAGRMTVVRLTGRWSASDTFNQNNAVRLPDGWVAGYRAAGG